MKRLLVLLLVMLTITLPVHAEVIRPTDLGFSLFIPAEMIVRPVPEGNNELVYDCGNPAGTLEFCIYDLGRGAYSLSLMEKTFTAGACGSGYTEINGFTCLYCWGTGDEENPGWNYICYLMQEGGKTVEFDCWYRDDAGNRLGCSIMSSLMPV